MSSWNYESRASKRNRKKKAAAMSQRGSLDRYIVKGPQINSENQAPCGNDDGHGDDVEVETKAVDDHIVDEDNDVAMGDEGDDAAIDDDPNIYDDPNIVDEGNYTNIADEGNDADIFDPRTWDGLDQKRLIFWCKRVLRETCLLSMVLEINYLEGFLQYHTLEIYQMEKSVTENGLYIAKNLTKYFVFDANY
jgi:hypothetical protein